MKSKVLLTLSIAFLFLAGCQEKEEISSENSNEEVMEVNEVSVDNEASATEPTEEQISEMRLVEQGFEIEYLYTTKDEEVIFLELSREGEAYFAMMDGSYEWVLKPTNKIKEMEYDRLFGQSENDFVIYETETASIVQDGLIALAVQDDRPREDDGLLWGFMNTKGEWVIEPQYRSVKQFSEGVAVVETIEEDRDDLQNYRTIAIDKKGNELFEIAKFDVKKETDEEFVEVDIFKNGYLKTSKGVYNTEGQLFAMDFIPDFHDVDGLFKNYEIIGDQAVTIFDNKIKVFSLDGKLVRDFAYPMSAGEEEEVGELADSDLHIYTPKALAELNQFIVYGKIMDLNGKVVLDKGSYLDDILISRDSSGEEEAYKFYDLKGNPLTDPNMVGVQLGQELYYNEPHWEEGSEYYKLISPTGEELIGEDRKVSSVSDIGHKIVEARVTDPTTLDETEMLININTLEFFRRVDL